MLKMSTLATNRRSYRAALLALALGLAAATTAHSQGMMGGGMMGGGMMGGYGPRTAEPPAGSASAPGWGKLSTYIQDNGLPCLSCHALSSRSAGPAFLDIAHRFFAQPSGASELAVAIRNGVAGQWPGYPPMPGGMATREQATRLASLILDLAP